jgi:hypothetical protein
MSPRPRLIHITTTDMSLDWLLGPQLEAFAAAGFDVIGASAAGPHVPAIEARGVRHIALANATRAMAPHRDVLALCELSVRPSCTRTIRSRVCTVGSPRVRRGFPWW